MACSRWEAAGKEIAIMAMADGLADVRVAALLLRAFIGRY
jgi:hypothetical protein|tara:strand:+ start:1665 stop:1784 length:120 start_codon:yes stop_codon:yes gene_type:complete